MLSLFIRNPRVPSGQRVIRSQLIHGAINRLLAHAMRAMRVREVSGDEDQLGPNLLEQVAYDGDVGGPDGILAHLPRLVKGQVQEARRRRGEAQRLDAADGFCLTNNALDVLHLGDVDIAGPLRRQEVVHALRELRDFRVANLAVVLQTDHEIDIAAHVVVEDGDVPAGHVRNDELVLVLHQLPENTAHRDDVIIRVRREDDDARAARELRLSANLRAEHVEHLAVRGSWRSEPRHQRRQLVLGVVALRHLQNGLSRLLRQPDDGPDGELRRPLHLIEEPGCREAGEIGSGGPVDVEGRVRMLLKERGGDLDVDLPFDGAANDAGLMLAGRENEDLARVHDRGDAHRERLTRNVLLAEEVGGGILTRDVVEMHRAGPALDARARLVETDVPGLSDAEELQVDPAGLANRFLVPQAFQLEVLERSVPARDVNVLGPDVDVREQILPHEPVVAVNAVRPHGVVLVEIERHHVSERQPFVAMHSDELAIDADGRRAGREAKHR